MIFRFCVMSATAALLERKRNKSERQGRSLDGNRRASAVLWHSPRCRRFRRVAVGGGRSWWAHFEFTRINIADYPPQECMVRVSLRVAWRKETRSGDPAVPGNMERVPRRTLAALFSEAA